MYSNRQLFLAHVGQTSPEPMALEIVHARGIYLKDVKGKRYMDLISGISVSNLGHCHPSVTRAVQRQLKKYTHLMVYGEYIQAPQAQLARLLTSQLPVELESVYFVNSGSEAVEGAMKLAKRFTGRQEIIHCQHSYHGSTQGALSIMGDEYFKSAFRPLLPGTRAIRFNQPEDLAYITQETACVIMEPVQGEAGVISPENAYLEAVRKKCTETGTLLVFDEIQTGYGRTGHLFAFQKFQVVPDILLLAKGFGGGFPLGAFISSKRIMDSLTTTPVLGHITTFGGHPVSCAAGLETLKVLLKTNLVAEVKAKETLFLELLQHPMIKEVRSNGFLLAVEFEDATINKQIIKKCIDNGIITDWFLFNDRSMRIAPPLIITEAEIRKACKKILACLEEKH